MVEIVLYHLAPAAIAADSLYQCRPRRAPYDAGSSNTKYA
jgi:hypothetical protein